MARLRDSEVETLGVDFNPEIVDDVHERGLEIVYGDAEDQTFIANVPLRSAQWVISTLPDWDSTRILLDGLKRSSYEGKVAGVARDEDFELRLHQAGVDKVLTPFADASDFAASWLRKSIL